MIDEQGLYDIYGLIHIPFWQTKLFIVGISILGVMLLAALLLLSSKFGFFSRSSPPYWEKVISELEVLQRDPWLKQDPKVLYSSLTKIVKGYISVRFNAALEGSTDSEIVQILKKHLLFTAEVPDIRPLFEEIAPIKFAKTYQITRTIEKDISLSLIFVQKTIPRET